MNFRNDQWIRFIQNILGKYNCSVYMNELNMNELNMNDRK